MGESVGNRRVRWRHCLALTKPRLILLVLVTTAVGYLMAAPTPVSVTNLAHVLVGVALVAGGGGALNQYSERAWDALMPRTATRPLPAGHLRPEQALWCGLGLTILGFVYVGLMLDPLTLALAIMSSGVYLLAYTPLKRRTPLCLLVGAFTGALPPVMGWTAAAGRLDWGAAGLFAILYVWQLPHFLAIAWLYRADYARADFAIARLVDERGRRIAWQIPLLSLCLIAASLFPVYLGLVGAVYALAAGILGTAYFLAALWRPAEDASRRARRLFRVSLLYLPLLLLAMALAHAIHMRG